MHANRTLSISLVALWLAPAVLFAGPRLPDIFSDHLVLQRDRPVPVWGWADDGLEVTVAFAGQTKKAVADKLGRWTVTLNAMKANNEPQTMTVVWSNGEREAIHDVLVGDVWLCSGQSNMAMTVDGRTAWLYIGGVANAKHEVRNSANPLLRQFYVDWKTDTKPQETCTGNWTVAGPDTTANFTATGYFFARELQGFAICDSTRCWVNAQAKIKGTTVVVWSDEVKHPVAVRYAWADHPVCNLYNQAGLPAFPFRTDKFSGLSERNE